MFWGGSFAVVVSTIVRGMRARAGVLGEDVGLVIDGHRGGKETGWSSGGERKRKRKRKVKG